MRSERVIVFGATGTLGSTCVHEIQSRGNLVISLGRDLGALENVGPIDAVVWAQGANFTGSLMETGPTDWETIWSANFTFIVDSIRALEEQESLVGGTRLVVLSSVWQEFARAEKVAYVSSKAALGGLVRALAVEYGPRGIAINSVLPGIVLSPMSQKNLTSDQIQRIASETPGNALAKPEDVARVVAFLASSDSHGINGQSIIVDNGWSIARHV